MIEKVLKKIICCLIPYAPWRHWLMRNRRDLIRVVEPDGRERGPGPFELLKIYVTELPGCSGNRVFLRMPYGGMRLKVCFGAKNCAVEIGESVRGTCEIGMSDDDSGVRIGARTTLGHCQMAITGSRVEIGTDCMLADNVLFFAGDSHSIIDKTTGEVKNARPAPIVVGNHCWLGRDCVFNKGSGVADESIVGIRSVVTKRCNERCVALAGCPAKVVTRDVGWDFATPQDYVGIRPRS